MGSHCFIISKKQKLYLLVQLHAASIFWFWKYEGKYQKKQLQEFNFLELGLKDRNIYLIFLFQIKYYVKEYTSSSNLNLTTAIEAIWPQDQIEIYPKYEFCPNMED